MSRMDSLLLCKLVKESPRERGGGAVMAVTPEPLASSAFSRENVLVTEDIGAYEAPTTLANSSSY